LGETSSSTASSKHMLSLSQSCEGGGDDNGVAAKSWFQSLEIVRTLAEVRMLLLANPSQWERSQTATPLAPLDSRCVVASIEDVGMVMLLTVSIFTNLFAGSTH